jgi:hypothetical protein
MKSPGILASEQPTRRLSLDPETVRGDFPILKQTVYGKPLVTWTMRRQAKNPRQ